MAVDASYFDGFGHVLRDDLRGWVRGGGKKMKKSEGKFHGKISIYTTILPFLAMAHHLYHTVILL